ncbi:MAG: WbqC family protein [Bacteroidaceae bacterium]|nr:WbqC family protein [Bacteroidaceae bacterium]
MNHSPLPTAYLAPISWYRSYRAAANPVIDTAEHYVKQTLRNRCTIAMPDGPQHLVIPVEAASSHVPIRDIRISEHGNWRHHHWNALRTAYGKSPFFEYCADDFAPFYLSRTHDYLIDFNAALHELVSTLIDLQQEVPATLQRSREGAPLPYYQVFRQRLGFLPDLSIVDLLFNMGPEAIFYL